LKEVSPNKCDDVKLEMAIWQTSISCRNYDR